MHNTKNNRINHDINILAKKLHLQGSTSHITEYEVYKRYNTWILFCYFSIYL